ncbi:MAG: FHA domain-containing protein [Rhodanobacteraceae bacterium]
MSAAQSSDPHSGIRITVVGDDGDGTSFALPVESGVVRIGRAIENDIILSDERVSRLHARVNVTEQRCEVEDKGSRTGVVVNGEPISSATRLRAGDLLRLGTTLLRFDSDRKADQPPEARASEPLAVLRVSSAAAGKPQPYPLSAGEYLIGRDPGCEIVLTGENVARYHVHLSVTADGTRAVDLGSASGTLCNGIALTSAKRLHFGDALRIGAYALQYSEPEKPVASPKPEMGQRVAIEHTVFGSIDQIRAASQVEFALVCLSGTARGMRYPLSGDRQVLGSARDCHPQLIGVPAKVATLNRMGDGYQMVLEPGASAVRVTGGRKPPCLLVAGDLIDLGGSVFRLIRHGDVFTARFDPGEFDAPSFSWKGLGASLKSLWRWPPWGPSSSS